MCAVDLADEVFQMVLPGSVVFLDTAIRFLNGDENSSKDVRAFADTILSLLKNGVEAVVVLHHSPKDAGDCMTLENAMRDGDMGAFLACAWGTKLQDPPHPDEPASYLENLKQHDFESTPFEVTCGPDWRMRIVGDPATQTATLQADAATKGTKTARMRRRRLSKQSQNAGAETLQEQLAAMEIDRGTTWIAKKRGRIMAETGKSGVRLSG